MLSLRVAHVLALFTFSVAWPILEHALGEAKSLRPSCLERVRTRYVYSTRAIANPQLMYELVNLGEVKHLTSRHNDLFHEQQMKFVL